MEIRWLEAFIAVAEELHFGRAAARLHMAQSPLSQTIRRLESEIGADLFDRNTRTVSLTPAGSALLPRAYRVVQDLALAADAARATSGVVHGPVRIGFSGAFNHHTLPALARAVRREFPEIDLQLTGGMTTADGLTRLRNGTIDIAFVGLPITAHGVSSRLVAHSEMGAVLPEDHPLAGSESISISQLADEDFLSMPTGGGSVMADTLVRCCVAGGFRPHVTQELTDPYMMLTFVAAGIGVTISVEDLRSVLPRGARWVSLSDPPQYVDHGIAWMSDETSAATAAVLELSTRILPTPD